MADFFGDIFNAVTGQKTAPQQTITSTQDLLNQGYQTSTGLSPQVIAYNQSLAPGLMDVQLGVEKQYDPNAFALRSATSRSILDQLGLGTSLPQDLQDQVIRNALESNAASGFGVGQGGRGLVAADLGLTGLELQNQRVDRALGAVRSSPSLSSLYQPQGMLNPAAVASDIRGVQAAQDEYANLKEDIRQKNFASLLNTGGRILGTAVGAYFGGAMGAKMGGDMGGSMIQGGGVAGQQQQQQAGGGGNFLSGLFGGGGSIGGPQYGVGAGRGYINSSGNFEQSVRAEQVMG